MAFRVRVDDFPLTKPEESWRHNLSNFKRFHEVFEKRNVSYTLGCIPRFTTPKHLEWLSSQELIEVALHGIDHDERFPNEFREWQSQIDVEHAIRSVKEVWDTRVGPVTSYIPPHNIIDLKTMRALKSVGFKTIFGGPGTEFTVLNAAALDYGMEYFYSRNYQGEPFHEYGRSDEMTTRGAIPYLRELVGCEFVNTCLSLHWTWEMNIGLSSLEKFLGEVFGG